MKYNEIIRQQRIKSNLTQQQLADKAGVSRQTVARWENGWIIPSLFCAQKLSAIFNISVTELMTGEQMQSSLPQECANPSKFPTLTAVFCLFTFLPFALYLIFHYFIYSVELDFLSSQFSTAYTISQAYTSNIAVCGLFFIFLFALWIIRLVSVLRSARDKYIRYSEYKIWKFGLLFLLVNVIAWAEFLLLSYLSFILPLLYCNAFFIAMPLWFTIDLTIQKIIAKKTVTKQNNSLRKINWVFLIISAVCLTVFGISLICSYSILYPAQAFTAADITIIYTGVAIMVETSYVIVYFIYKNRNSTST